MKGKELDDLLTKYKRSPSDIPKIHEEIQAIALHKGFSC